MDKNKNKNKQEDFDYLIDTKENSTNDSANPIMEMENFLNTASETTNDQEYEIPENKNVTKPKSELEEIIGDIENEEKNTESFKSFKFEDIVSPDEINTDELEETLKNTLNENKKNKEDVQTKIEKKELKIKDEDEENTNIFDKALFDTEFNNLLAKNDAIFLNDKETEEVLDKAVTDDPEYDDEFLKITPKKAIITKKSTQTEEREKELDLTSWEKNNSQDNKIEILEELKENKSTEKQKNIEEELDLAGSEKNNSQNNKIEILEKPKENTEIKKEKTKKSIDIQEQMLFGDNLTTEELEISDSENNFSSKGDFLDPETEIIEENEQTNKKPAKTNEQLLFENDPKIEIKNTSILKSDSNAADDSQNKRIETIKETKDKKPTDIHEQMLFGDNLTTEELEEISDSENNFSSQGDDFSDPETKIAEEPKESKKLTDIHEQMLFGDDLDIKDKTEDDHLSTSEELEKDLIFDKDNTETIIEEETTNKIEKNTKNSKEKKPIETTKDFFEEELEEEGNVKTTTEKEQTNINFDIKNNTDKQHINVHEEPQKNIIKNKEISETALDFIDLNSFDLNSLEEVEDSEKKTNPFKTKKTKTEPLKIKDISDDDNEEEIDSNLTTNSEFNDFPTLNVENIELTEKEKAKIKEEQIEQEFLTEDENNKKEQISYLNKHELEDHLESDFNLKDLKQLLTTFNDKVNLSLLLKENISLREKSVINDLIKIKFFDDSHPEETKKENKKTNNKQTKVEANINSETEEEIEDTDTETGEDDLEKLLNKTLEAKLKKVVNQKMALMLEKMLNEQLNTDPKKKK